MKIREYQKEAITAGIHALSRKKNELIVLPTGTGKSLVIASIAHAVGGRTLVLQPSVEIIRQNQEKMRLFGVEDTGVFSASAGEKSIRDITFGMIGTVFNCPELAHKFDRIFIDEAHAVNAESGRYAEIIREFGVPILGFTATPWRMHSYRGMMRNPIVTNKLLFRTRPRVFSGVAYHINARELQKQGYLAQLKWSISYGYQHHEIVPNSTGMSFNERSLKKYNEDKGIINLAVNSVKVQKKSKHILIFSNSIEEAKKTTEELNSIGAVSSIVTATTPPKEREEIIKKFKAGEIRAVANVGTLTTGFDFPALDCVILARPTRSVSLYSQMVGRAVRPAPGKEFATIIDLCGNYLRYGSPYDFALEERDKKIIINSANGLLSDVDIITRRPLGSFFS